MNPRTSDVVYSRLIGTQPVGADPPWLDECRRVVFGQADPRAAELQLDAIRAVLAFAARQPREITPEMVEAAQNALCSKFQMRQDAAEWYARTALEAAIDD